MKAGVKDLFSNVFAARLVVDYINVTIPVSSSFPSYEVYLCVFHSFIQFSSFLQLPQVSGHFASFCYFE